MQAWQSGADGLYLFNYSLGPWLPLFQELGDPASLAKLDKIYATLPHGIGLLAWLCKNAVPLVSVPRLAPDDPMHLEPGGVREIAYFPVGDDVLWGRDEGIEPHVTLRIQVGYVADAGQLRVTMNDRILTAGVVHMMTRDWVEYRVDPSLVRRGNNRFTIGLAAAAPCAVALMDLQLAVRYRPAGS